jgi:hypothetical protein
MDKNTYMVVVETKDGKYSACVYKHHNSYNLVGMFIDERYVTANICDSKKEAEHIAEYWNDGWKKEGKNMY